MSSGLAELATSATLPGCPEKGGSAAEDLLIPGRMESLLDAYCKSLSWGGRDAWRWLPPAQDKGQGSEPSGPLVAEDMVPCSATSRRKGTP